MIYFEPYYKQKLTTVITDQNAYLTARKTDDFSLDTHKHRHCELRFTFSHCVL